MKAEVTYIIDNKGHKTSVIVPVNSWEKLNVDYNKLLKKVEVLTGNKRKSDYWNTLSREQKDEIERGIAEIEKGDTVEYEHLMKKHRR